MQNLRGEPRWLIGTITEQTDSVSYKVLVEDQLWKRHIDQMHQKRESQIVHPNRGEIPNIAIDQEVVDTPPIVTPRSESRETNPKKPISKLDKASTAQATATTRPQAEPRYPTRQRKAPQRLGVDS